MLISNGEGVPKTVLFLDHTARLGGGEIALLHLAADLDRARYIPLVALGEEGPLADRLRAAGVETVILALDPSVVETRKDTLGAAGALRLERVWRVVSYAARVARFARSRGVALIHTNSLKADLYGGIAGRLARIPTVWHLRDRLADDYLPRPAIAAFRLLARVLPHAVVVNSDSTRRTLGPSLSRRATVVHDGCDPQRFQSEGGPGRAREEDGPVVTLLGRIAPWKGQMVFVEAAARILQRIPGARFRIVGSPLFGEDAYEEAVRARAEKLGVASSVEFAGFREDVPAVLSASDIVVHASTLGEPFGQVVIEAMAAGRPVVATDGGALPEIVEAGCTGLLVPMGDAGAMAEAVQSLLADPGRAGEMGRAGRRRVEECFTVQRTVAGVQSVYARLLAGTAVEGRIGAPASTERNRVAT